MGRFIVVQNEKRMVWSDNGQFRGTTGGERQVDPVVAPYVEHDAGFFFFCSLGMERGVGGFYGWSSKCRTVGGSFKGAAVESVKPTQLFKKKIPPPPR